MATAQAKKYRVRSLPVASLVFGIVMAGCSAAAAPPSSQATTSSEATTMLAPGCGSSSAGSTTLHLRIAGRQRLVIVHVPSGYSGDKSLALVLNFHGSGSTAAEQEAFSGMDATADANGFIVAYPQAEIPDGSGYDWNIPGVPLVGGRAVPAGTPSDVGFAVVTVHAIESRYCVDPKEVYATGFSGGARLTSQLGCDASQFFAAIAPVSGLRRPSPCPITRPMPVLSFHGEADPIDPYDGHGQQYWTYSVPTAARDWASTDGCSLKAELSKPAKGVTLSSYSGCSGGVEVSLYSIAAEGHEWPGGPRMPRALRNVLGPQTTAISASEIMWRFFSGHRL